MKIFHNPRCSKSRETLSLIQEQGIKPEIVEYLKTPPTVEELKALLSLLTMRPRDIIRTKDESFASLHLNLDDDAAVLVALAQHPELLERAIVVRDGRAVVARPPEKVRDLF
ncbi:MAG TPA: arsenate reductase (glutaredoxin) [Oligoflexus sp.]|uniref:arsenate reductase (glutaredoxin) n=1 Tax=Oligoflexus sp. TaxID=1971216 RepID=UPI002D72D42E|nr:arsenate reductase (glutaredoxin) [Oligoflexus sp.]HYX32417.1 arsenate reductase (glutaredoxin) [Oligoflexus sp.]